MKSIILIALAVVAVAVAAPADPPAVEIVEQNFNPQPDGSFTWRYKTSDGSSQQQVGELKQTVDEDNKPRTVLVISGVYGFINDKGEPVEISYKADENGYEATGDSIPKPVQARR